MKMIIASGGTGGHLFPALALAEELLSRTPGNEVCFVGTARGLEARVVPEKGYTLKKISAAPLRGTGIIGTIKSLLAMPKAVWESLRILRSERPDMVVGVGGYASGPVVLAAWMLRVHRVICEQNTIPGTTSRILGFFAEAVFIAFEQARRFFPRGRTYLMGNPIRRKLLDNYLRSKVPGSKFSVLAFGGSQGAHVLNVAVAEAFEKMGVERDGISLVHQTGKTDMEMVKSIYSRTGYRATVVEFIDDMADAYRKADLVICRAGATSVAELGVCRKPSILVPYPFAADNHQMKNAEAMAEAGAAILIVQDRLDGGVLAAEMMGLKNNPERLHGMEAAAGAVGRPEAAKECVDFCIELAGR